MRLRSTTLSRRWVAGPGSIQARNFVNFYFCSDVIVSDKGRKLCFSSFIRLYAGLFIRSVLLNRNYLLSA